jgi:glycosyltransferase involved in cell wall biosynthesis
VTQPSISVVICVYTEKRWREILEAVESIRQQSEKSLEIVLVVDHNPVLRDRLANALPDVIVLENKQAQGLSGGRNTGISVAHGDVVAFLDDDAVAEPDWLKYLGDCYEDPAVLAAGGRTLPNWETREPNWFPQEFAWTVGASYLGMPQSRAAVRNIMGGNASYRRELFQQVGGFANTIGRSAGKRPMGCEETELCIRIRQFRPEAVLLFETQAVIHHLVPANRSRFSYFTSRCYAEGLSKAAVAASVGAQDALSSERSYTTRTLPKGVARNLGAAIRGDLWGVTRAAAIVIGLSATVAGYAVGSISLRAHHDKSESGSRPDRELSQDVS